MKRFFSILILLALLVPLVAFASAPARTHGNDAEKRVPTEAPTETVTEARAETSKEVSTEAPTEPVTEAQAETSKEVLTEAPTEAPSEDEPTTTKKRISEMNDQELEQFIEEYVNILDFKNKDLCFNLLKAYLSMFDSDYRAALPLNATIYYVLAKEIDKGVERYYGLTKKDFIPVLEGTRSAWDPNPTTEPKQNEFLSAPANMLNFNCYGYALGMYGWLEPGFANEVVLDLSTTSVATLANHVKNDLKNSSLEQDCVRITTTSPSTSLLSSGYKVICIRKGNSSQGGYDYHLMKLTSSGWTHKPGGTAIIKHTKNLSNTTNWRGEYAWSSSDWRLGDMTYKGTIYYIIYKANHTASGSAEYTGNNYHLGKYHYYEKVYTCSGCGATYGAYMSKVPCSGPPCNLPFGIPNDTNER